MTEKRFINDVDNGMLYDTKGEMYTIPYDDRVDFYSLWEFLNKLNDENESLKKENKELRQDNDIKFWKLQCMRYFNSNSLFMSEISRAMRKGYKVSDKFQEYLDDLKENSKEIKEKHKRLFGDS